MSAPDIGTLRGLVKAYDDAWAVLQASSVAVNAAVAAALASEFGPVERHHLRRVWRSGHASVLVIFDQIRAEWRAMASRGHDDLGRSVATTPRAAVEQALAALRLTHPEAADALAAVIPPAPVSPA